MGDILDDLAEVKTVLETPSSGKVMASGLDGMMANVVSRAMSEIRHLRSLAGVVSQGPSFAEATKGVSRRSVEPDDPRGDEV
jgi:hypothetical protein